MYTNLVVGTDGSETATKAVQQAAELAAALGAKVHLVLAFDRRSRTTGMRDASIEAPADVKQDAEPIGFAEATLEAAREIVTGAGVADVEIHAVDADPAQALLDIADRVNADLIVVGNKGMTGASRFLLGSVPNKVSHHASCTVMIVRTT